jgi:phage I-like protein
MIGGMTTAAPTSQKALMAALDLPDGEVPEWVHLVPTAKGQVETDDSRGPYEIADAEAVIAASFAGQSKLQIDENHNQDHRAKLGEPTPARGWITELQARENGIWGKVQWTKAGRELVADQAYRAMSPVILHAKNQAKTILAIIGASLVNRPNFKGLVTLNQEQSMDFMAKMAAALGLAEGASEDDVMTAIKALKDKKPEGDMPALQSAMSEIGVALGVAADAKPDAVIAAAQLAKGGKDSLVALQSQVTSLTTQLTAIQGDGKRQAAERFIDKAITDRRAGVNAQNREAMISLHMSDTATAEQLVNGMPMLTTTGTLLTPPAAKDGVVSLNAAQQEACVALGISEEDYKKSLAEETR